MTSELFASKLLKNYGTRRVVNKVSLSIKGGDVVALLGPNGAGKTTVFYMIVGLVSPDAGTVSLNGVDVTEFPTYVRALNGLGYLPQEASIFAKLTVKDNLMIILEFMPLTSRERTYRANELLDELGILKLAKKRAFVLSGGERRRLEIARTLIMNPKIILLDEPFAGVDPVAVVDIVDIINYLRSKNIGVLISDHNVRETLKVCDKVIFLGSGEVIDSGSPKKIINNVAVKKLYLGDEFVF